MTDLIEPLVAYKSGLKDKVKETTTEYFEELTNKSGVDVEANKKTCSEYYKTLNAKKDYDEKVSSKKTLKALCIIGIIVSVILAIVFFVLMTKNTPFVAAAIVFLLLIPLFIYLIISTNKTLKTLIAERDKLAEKASELKKQAYDQMSCLNKLYDWNIPALIFNKNQELMVLDKNFDVSKYEYLKSHYNVDQLSDENTSCIYVESGSILGNPFFIAKDLKHTMGNKTYSNSITIHWTTTVRTKDGTRTEHHSETLTAEVTKPYPYYNTSTYLIYGNDAAPNLSFTRRPSGANSKSEKELDKMVKKTAKKLDKRAEKELMDNDPKTNYQRFGNDEFEVLFGGTDRDNELEYNLLFTPLAQKNLLALIKGKDSVFGDDFYFSKEKKLNLVQSYHSQKFDYRTDPTMFIHFDYEKAKDFFISYNCKYFDNLYFDLAPLISIPLYQQTATTEYIYEEGYPSNISVLEQETIANQFDPNLFKTPEFATDAILKTETLKKMNGADLVKVTASGYYSIEHIEHISKLGGDGHWHDIPVKWYEYLPLQNVKNVVIEKKDTTRNSFMNTTLSQKFKETISKYSNNYHYERGLFGFILDDDKAVLDNDLDDINKNIQ